MVTVRWTRSIRSGTRTPSSTWARSVRGSPFICHLVGLGAAAGARGRRTRRATGAPPREPRPEAVPVELLRQVLTSRRDGPRRGGGPCRGGSLPRGPRAQAPAPPRKQSRANVPLADGDGSADVERKVVAKSIGGDGPELAGPFVVLDTAKGAYRWFHLPRLGRRTSSQSTGGSGSGRGIHRGPGHGRRRDRWRGSGRRDRCTDRPGGPAPGPCVHPESDRPGRGERTEHRPARASRSGTTHPCDPRGDRRRIRSTA